MSSTEDGPRMRAIHDRARAARVLREQVRIGYLACRDLPPILELVDAETTKAHQDALEAAFDALAEAFDAVERLELYDLQDSCRQ